MTHPIDLSAHGVAISIGAISGVSPERAVRSVTEELFVGRTRELGEMHSAFGDVRQGQGRLLLVSGEPGIGKTRLVSVFAGDALRRGAQVLWGRCGAEQGAPRYWPWLQVVDAYLRESGSASAEMVANAMAVRRSLAEPALPLEAGGAPAADGDVQGFQLLGGVLKLVRAASAQRPVVMVLDDLHGADEPTLLLLDLLCRELRSLGLLVVATYAEAEARAISATASRIAQLARVGRSIVLHGLGREETTTFIERAAGQSVLKPVSEAIWERAQGNPFFLQEILRALLAERRLERPVGDELLGLRVPAQVRHRILQRLRTLPLEVRGVLGAAAVIGREFDLDLLEHIAPPDGASRDRLLDLLGSAATLGLVRRVSAVGQRHAFAHPLVHETLYEDVTPGLRLRLHAGAGAALAARGPETSDRQLAEIAHHFFHAVPLVEPERALAYQTTVADRATRRADHLSAAEHYRRALQLIETQPDTDGRAQCRLLLALGDAQASAADTSGTRRTFERAADLAEALGLSDELGRAALGLTDVGGEPAGERDPVASRLLERALAALPPQDSPLRARLTARLAIGRPAFPERDELSAQAVELARRLAEPLPLAHVLCDRCLAIWNPANCHERLDLVEEIIRLAGETGEGYLVLRARIWRALTLIEIGDAEAADLEIAEIARRATSTQCRRSRGIAAAVQAARAVSRGHLEDAERWARQVVANGDREGAVGLPIVAFQSVIFGGRADQLAVAKLGGANRDRGVRLIECGLMFIHGAADRIEEAQSELETEFATIANDSQWLIVHACLAALCAALGDQERARLLYDILEPYGDRVVVGGPSAPYVDVPVAHVLGLLATVVRRWEAAARHFEVSLEIEVRLRARPHAASTQCAYAAMLLERAEPGDGDRAAALVAQALATAREIGMNALVERLEPQHVRLQDAGPPADGQAPPASTASLFVREGEYWTIGFAGDVFRCRHVRGLKFIAHLLQDPGREIHALELVRVGDTDEIARERAARDDLPATGLGDQGPMLDDTAIQSYKRALADLRLELQEATSYNDVGRSTKLQAEIEFLTAELGRALGIGGRVRRSGSVAERARVNVTRAIIAAIKRVADHHPGLARHLTASIATGTFCVYRPEARSASSWTVTL